MKNEDLDAFQSGALHFTVLGLPASQQSWYQLPLDRGFSPNTFGLRILLQLLLCSPSFLFLSFFPLPKSKAEPTSHTLDAAAVNTWHPPHPFYFCTDID